MHSKLSKQKSEASYLTPTKIIDEFGNEKEVKIEKTNEDFQKPNSLELIKINSKAQTAFKEASKVGYKRALEFKEKLVFETPSKKQKMTHEEKYNDIQLSIKSFAAQEELRLKF